MIQVVISGPQVAQILIEERLLNRQCRSHLKLAFDICSLRTLRKEVAFLGVVTLPLLVKIFLLVLTLEQGVVLAVVRAFVVSGVVPLVQVGFKWRSLAQVVLVIHIYSKLAQEEVQTRLNCKKASPKGISIAYQLEK